VEGELTLHKYASFILSVATLFSFFALAGMIHSGVRAEESQKVPVKVLKASRRNITSTLTAMGSIDYLSKSDVSSELDGVLSSVNLEEGDLVKKDQVIAKIDSALLQAQLKQKLAVQELAEIELARWDNEIRKAEYKIKAGKISVGTLKEYLEEQRKLFKIGGITQLELSQAEMKYQNTLAEYKTAIEELRSLKTKSKQGRNEAEARVAKCRADADEIRAKLKKCIIKAPISGVVSSKMKWTGERTIPQNATIATILETTEVYAVAELSEKNVGLVKAGQPAEVIVDAFSDISFSGTVHLISPTIDTDSRTVKVRIKVPNSKMLLRPGMFARVEVILDSQKDVVAVPSEAILKAKEGRKLVFVVIDEIAFLREVQTGSSKNDWVVITKGIKDGDKVVVEGHERLSDLASVKSMEITTE
jgi:multidrug efflux pump subunit AcrA (membrane-fusion protein)